MSTNKVVYNNFIQLLLLILFFNACTSKNIKENTKRGEVILTTSDFDIFQQDTTLQLNFPSGIRAILEDRKGNFWFGSHQEGACFFNGKDFKYFTVDDGLADNQVRDIQEDNDGRIWFSTAQGVSSYDGEKMLSHVVNGKLIRPTLFPAEWKNESQDLWFHGGDNPGVYRYNGQEVTYLLFPPSISEDTENPLLVTKIVAGQNEKLWFASYPAVIGFSPKDKKKNAVFKSYDSSNFTFINDNVLGYEVSPGNGLHVRSILEDSKGNLWIGNNGIGVLYYDGKSIINFSVQKGVSKFNESNKNVTSVVATLNHVFEITEDRAGNIWFGDRDTGVWRYDGEVLRNFTKEDGLTSVFPWEIYEDSKGVLWFGMANGDVFCFNGELFESVF